MTTNNVLSARGQYGHMSFDGSAVTITRERFSLQGMSRKTIPLRHITSVQLRPAGRILRGFLSLSLGGGDERRSRAGSQAMDAMQDENSVVFSYKANADFQALADALDAAIREA